jgi:tetratricopeptide (TPR) repeat protein
MERFEQGLDFQERGLFDLAIQEYTKALEFEPENLDVLVNLGAAYLQKGLPEKSVQVLTRALSHQADHPLALFNLGKAHLYREQPEQALAVFERVEIILPEDLEVKKSIAQCLISLNRKEEAVEFLLPCREVLHTDLPNLFLLGKTLTELGRYVDALEVYRKAVSAAPDSAEALDGLVRCQLELGLPDKAMTSLRRALMVFPTSPEFNLLLTDLLINSGSIDEAVETLKKTLAANPDHTEVRKKAEEVSRRLPILKKKAGHASLVEKTSPFETDVYDILDGLYDGRVQLSAAIAALQGLRERDPQDLFIADELANLLFQAKQYPDALEIYEIIQHSMPHEHRHRLNFAKCLALTGQLEQAQEFIIDSISEFPVEPELPLAFVELKLLERNFPEALTVLEKTMQKFPDNTHGLFLHGYILLRTGNLDFAAEVFRKLIRYTPEDEEVVMWYSRLMILLQKPQEAFKAWEQFRDGIQSFLEILAKIELYLTLGDWDSAKGLLMHVGKFEPRFLEDYLMFGKAAFYARDFHRTQEYMEMVLKQDPHNPDGLTFLALSYLMRSKWAKFWMVWQKAIESDSLFPVLAALVVGKTLPFSQLERLKNETRKILDISIRDDLDRARLSLLLRYL